MPPVLPSACRLLVFAALLSGLGAAEGRLPVLHSLEAGLLSRPPGAEGRLPGFLSLEAGLREGMTRHPDLLAAEEGLRAAELKLRAAHGAFFPTLTAQAGLTLASNASADPLAYSAGVSIQEELWGGLRTVAGVRRATAERDAARAQRDAQRLSVAQQVRKAYFQLAYEQDNRDLSRATAARRKENLDLVSLRFESGRENKGSLLRSEAQWLEAAVDVSNALRGLRLGMRALALALGRPPFETLAVQASPELPHEPPPEYATLALRTPGYALARTSLELARAQRTSALGAFSPVLSAGASWSQRSAAVGAGNLSANLGLSWSFGTGLEDAWNAQAALCQVRSAERDLRRCGEELAVELERAYEALASAREQEAVRRKYLEASETQAEIARTQYASGLLSYANWDLIENNLIENRKSALGARKAVALAWAAWEQAKGRP